MPPMRLEWSTGKTDRTLRAAPVGRPPPDSERAGEGSAITRSELSFRGRSMDSCDWPTKMAHLDVKVEWASGRQGHSESNRDCWEGQAGAAAASMPNSDPDSPADPPTLSRSPNRLRNTPFPPSAAGPEFVLSTLQAKAISRESRGLNPISMWPSDSGQRTPDVDSNEGIIPS